MFVWYDISSESEHCPACLCAVHCCLTRTNSNDSSATDVTKLDIKDNRGPGTGVSVAEEPIPTYKWPQLDMASPLNANYERQNVAFQANLPT